LGKTQNPTLHPPPKEKKPEPLGWLTSLAARMFFGLPVFFAIFGLG
jgi:hypothetical protein